MAVKGTAVATLAIGGILVWSGIFNKKVTQTIQDIVKGQKPTPGPESNPPDTSGGSPFGGGSLAPVSGASEKANRAKGKLMAGAYGWSTGAQWDALDWIWTEESGWSNTAANPSGAYGIPQALPGSKMGPLANPPVNSATVQIAWGLRYIKERYGNPVAAKAFHLEHGWY
jgi:hypothetical protein